MPDRFKQFYRLGAIKAAVLRFDKSGRAVLDKGSADRLQPGMLLAHYDYGRSELKVESVEGHKAIARPFYYWNTSEKVKAGDLFSTGGAYNRPRGTGYQRFDHILSEAEQKSVEQKGIEQSRVSDWSVIRKSRDGKKQPE